MFPKDKANKFLERIGYKTLPSIIIKKGDEDVDIRVKNFFDSQEIGRLIVKPSHGGSSIGVFVSTSYKDAVDKVNLVMEDIDDVVILESF